MTLHIPIASPLAKHFPKLNGGEVGGGSGGVDFDIEFTVKINKEGGRRPAKLNESTVLPRLIPSAVSHATGP
jgi:hypothetical protein